MRLLTALALAFSLAFSGGATALADLSSTAVVHAGDLDESDAALREAPALKLQAASTEQGASPLAASRWQAGLGGLRPLSLSAPAEARRRAAAPALRLLRGHPTRAGP